ncbi:MAG: hypothetical protein H8E29_00110, partial [Anaerolineales bacterium]|nr:hypothetical protein [Candidatus Desulfolinea nitratireducens]
MKRTALIHPFLFTLTSVLFLYLPASALISPSQMVRPIIWLCICLYLLFYPAYKITKNWDWAGIVLTIFVFGFYCEETVFIILFFSSASLIILWLLYLRLRRKKGEVKETTFLLNLLSAALLLSGTLKLLSLLAHIPGSYYQKI